MKIIAINGSPRKTWNSAKTLEKWKEGFLSVIPTAEVKEVNLYDNSILIYDEKIDFIGILCDELVTKERL